MSIPSFIKTLTGEDIFDIETVGFLDSDIVRKLTEILNQAEFPIKKYKKRELDPLLLESFDKEIVDKISSLISSLSVFMQIADEYSELREMLDKAVSSAPDAKKELLETFFNSLKHFEHFYDYRRLERYKTRAINYYKNMSYSCNAIGRFKKDYDYKTMQIENYEPEIIDTVAMVSLRFITGDGENDNSFIFSVDEAELDQVVSVLLAAQKELKTLKNKIKY